MGAESTTQIDNAQVDDAIRALCGERVPAGTAMPNQLGLYAIHASPEAWNQLGLEPRDAPLFVGKTTHGLASRTLRSHFSTGSTGRSSLRRSLAALLQDSLALVAIPRSPTNPRNFANFALDAAGDERLTEWMNKHLRVTIWAAPESLTELEHLERDVLRDLQPPLNVNNVPHPSPRLKAARAALAQQARVFARASSAHVALVRHDVVDFACRYFDEDAEIAAQRVRRSPFGWEINTQPLDGGLLLGPGPILVDGETGDYWSTSSSPWDVFGEPGGRLGLVDLTSRALFEQWVRENRAADGNVLDEIA